MRQSLIRLVCAAHVVQLCAHVPMEARGDSRSSLTALPTDLIFEIGYHTTSN